MAFCGVLCGVDFFFAPAQVLFEPLPREAGYFFEGSRLFEEMRGMGDDLDALFAFELGEGLVVQVQNDAVVSTNDEQRWSLYLSQSGAGEIGPASTRDHCRNPVTRVSRGNKSSGGPCARAEVTDLHAFECRLLGEPFGCTQKTVCEKWNIESQLCGVAIEQLLVFSKEIEQERSETGVLEDFGYMAVARTEAAASASVCKDDDAAEVLWNA